MGSITHEPKYTNEPIAIVGSSCRFPGDATSPSKLWDLLKNPRDVVSEIPSTRFNTTGFYHPDSQNHGAHPRAFDRDFFGISPKEAQSMDPQQRMLLETVYEGIESAGYSMQQLRGSNTAVFVGVMFLDYQLISARGLDSLPQYHATGVAMSILANRLSYFYDWKGPSVGIDTACSSSLVALHYAVQTLRSGEAKMAVAAGSNLILVPDLFVSESSLNMLSPNGRSYMWDKDADGYTRGEGTSAVILKTLSQAISDGDHIECIIRETGVNQDGQTPGITMPSPTAQAELIRSTYAKAGLDLRLECDRPQYFEAHGTGTQAGDPREAEAISTVFFPKGSIYDRKLTVGSVKTLIGHLEGSAGLAGVLKTSQALQHGLIPANLHFKTLNPKIEPFYTNLQVPTETQPWPALPNSWTRRASVNSFGFGGTNAHAILEAWNSKGHESDSHSKSVGGLFVLSANSAQSLASRASQLCHYLESNPETDLRRLSYTLFQRANFSFRAAFSATSVQQLTEKLKTAVLNKTSRTASIPENMPPRILGVFTGQGAQWATMGAKLYESSIVFRSAFSRMQDSLDELSVKDGRPSWSLIEELRAPPATSHIGEAAVSQPICTAVQVALVDMLSAAGVQFSGVVGHSSGEIAAAYTAGYLNAHDAIRIAYFRGLHSKKAQGPDGCSGKMMAVGMSIDQAAGFCAESRGTIKIAASNSARSCTLAGDASAIDSAKEKLDAAGTFARVLQVDTAYHSHHMQPVAQPYLDSLQKCSIKINTKPGTNVVWYSSVWGSNGRSRSFSGKDAESLKGQYWVDNMTNTVLFSQAVQRAVNESHVFDFALEVGPHPALKGPATETINNMTGIGLPYSGVLKRGQHDVESFFDALGLLWKTFPLQSGRSIVSFDGIERAFAPGGKNNRLGLLKDLPSYPFDHDSVYWKESRHSAIVRTQNQKRHQLLGSASTFGSGKQREVHWKQVLRLEEIPWLFGHTIQGEYLFPATCYVTMAYEAAIRLVSPAQEIRLVELHDIDVFRALSLKADSPGTEILFAVRITSQLDGVITASWSCYSNPVDFEHGQNLGDMPAQAESHVEGFLRIELGAPRDDILPARSEPILPLIPLDVEELYDTLAVLGHGYKEHFQTPKMLRRLHHAVVSMPAGWHEANSLTRSDVNPAALDTGIHGLLAGYSCPGDRRQRSAYLPSRIDSIRISMVAVPAVDGDGPTELLADSFVTHGDASRISGDINVFNPENNKTHVQIRGVHLLNLPGSLRSSRETYHQDIWERDALCGIEPDRKSIISNNRAQISNLAMRLVLFYCQKVLKELKPFEIMLMGKARKNFLTWVQKVLIPSVRAGEHEANKEWLDDSEAELNQEVERLKLANSADVVLLERLGRNLTSITRGLTAGVKVAEQENALQRFYADSFGFRETTADAAALVSQICHRYPAMKMIEVGAGFGSGLRDALINAAGKRRYTSYTVTNTVEPSDDDSKLIFKLLDIDKDPVQQGFVEASYDLVIATTSYSTKVSQETVINARKLLRPGGFLLLVALTNDYLPVRFVQSLLPRTWLEKDDSRPQIITVSDCDALLKVNGFSGVDVTYTQHFCSVMLSQAVDDVVLAVRDPITVTQKIDAEILLVLDPSPSTIVENLASQLEDRLASFATVRKVSGLENINVAPEAIILNLCDLDTPVFQEMSELRFKGLQEIMRQASVLLWITEGARGGAKPANTMVLGWGRSARLERSTMKLQILDIEQESQTVDPDVICKLLLNLSSSSSDDQDILFTLEPELMLRGNAIYIPRIWPVDGLNELADTRYKDVYVETSATNPFAALDERGILAIERPYGHTPASDLEVLASSVHGFRFQGEENIRQLCISRNVAGESSLTLSDEDSLEILWQYENGNGGIGYPHQLQFLITSAIAEATLRSLSGHVWIHGAPSWLQKGLDLAASRRDDIQLFNTTSDREIVTGNTNFLHPFATERDLVLVKPKDIAAFVCLEDSQQDHNLVGLVRSIWPSIRIELPVLSLNSFDGVVFNGLSKPMFVDLVKWHLSSGTLVSENLAEGAVIPVEHISKKSPSSILPTSVLDRTTTTTITAKLLPPDHDGIFSSKKTYLLLGLAGDFGISIALWMFDSGARHVVLASRNPVVLQPVVDHVAATHGATLRFMAIDICDEGSLSAAWAEIHTSMPPVGGIMNGAMLMRDQLFADQPWSDFSAVMGPKVRGTQNLVALLDREVAPEQLDFVVFFSSAVAVAGNGGQTAYGSSNWFMQGTASNMRQRGYPGCVVHIGGVSGLGYVQRHEKRKMLEDSLYWLMSPVSETDLHDMLAEVIAGDRHDLITGIRGDIRTYTWREQPRLWHYLQSEDDSNDETAKEGSSASLKIQLASSVADPDACLDLLLGGFTSALCGMLHMKPEELDTNVPVASIGIDSLVAVRVREWFMQQVGVEVSVLKVMSLNTPLLALCKDVLAIWRKQVKA
ncbi:probable polyketide synthase [Fusarium mangiferae]|uniref:Reducing polyketide synthase 8 n=1 Tax=Fusarium mangiferae TaxID=192010 RepID=FMN1_FUSMA|nr:putative polyketide synthase [Fusarium mangiferae]A0A1L7U4V5.1 RecName: Full=Reducing polyketide synthase 8; Short=PKS8; AltName: Full=Fusamarins biosynthesis cluster protein 1 [Fusarium mangiferae]CVL03383.1 probable polyketide synthase [Fusarium mangiferae]